MAKEEGGVKILRRKIRFGLQASIFLVAIVAVKFYSSRQSPTLVQSSSYTFAVKQRRFLDSTVVETQFCEFDFDDELDDDAAEDDGGYSAACESTDYPPPYDFVGRGLLTCDGLENGGVIFYILGVLYMFLALAIVCDEFFVPALQVSYRSIGMRDDVAGATMMAAGGSAPELFTSFIGTFVSLNSIGFGTIVGSAVFNVLFVIGMCGIFSTQTLVLTWWPLARDCSFYTLALILLAMFFGPISTKNCGDGLRTRKQIEWWEAMVLLLLYVGYCVFMKYNLALKEYVFEKLGLEAKKREKAKAVEFHGLFLTTLIKHKTVLDVAARQMVALQGTMEEIFDKVDHNQDNMISAEEIQTMLLKMGANTVTLEDVKAEMRDSDILDAENNGSATREEFMEWYSKYETHIAKEMEDQFKEVSSDTNDLSINEHEFKKLLEKLKERCMNFSQKEAYAALVDAEESLTQLMKDGNLSYDDFQTWYQHSIFAVHHGSNSDGDDEDDTDWVLFCFPPFPTDSLQAQISYVITCPLLFCLYATIPNVSRQRILDWGSWVALVAFTMAIVWIAIFSFFMVWFATMIGYVFGISPSLMGLTLLAAGTSVPDLLTSVIVARQGKGDMAVSSSIGSNIFDVLVGLPLPWFFKSMIDGPVDVASDTLFLSLIILIFMLVCVFATIIAFKWELTRPMGYVMFVLYFVYVLQDILREKGVIPNPSW